MQYISTRGQSPAVSFEDAVLTGLAPDGGLYIPAELPQVSAAQLKAWATLSYQDLAFVIIKPFVAGAIPDAELRAMIVASYANFSDPKIAPLKHLYDNHYVLELYCGPTLAFKDFALQLLGRLLDYFLSRRQQHIAILGATSGDTGSAALEGCKHSQYLDLFILHPYQRVSEVQRRQMTTVQGNNVNNIALEGDFDDCQGILKKAFADQRFLPSGYQLGAVNSINWARIMAQIVYYFYAALPFLDRGATAVSFTVPTGNFGDIYAGYLAKKMGLPVRQLVIATNRNDILHRFISGNRYHKTALEPSLSPSMDIMVSSNFERFLYDLFQGDSARLTRFVTGLSTEVQQVSADEWAWARTHFDSASVDDATTCATIKEVKQHTGFLLDPHTATGVKAAALCDKDSATPMITLGTAHPAKFAVAIEQAGFATPALPPHMADLFQREERYTVLPNSLEAVKAFMVQALAHKR
ncbi:MAG: threonine synthase [Pseudomonadales bacterium]|jgi:threonine synthase|nr:threonine synthase [Pseudomonadales bacterium]